MSREVNMIGMAIAKGLEEHGQVGATHMGTASTRGIRATSTTRRSSRTSPRSGPRRRSTSTRRRTTTRSTTSRRTCATCGRRASTRARGRPAGGGCATRSTTWRRRRSSVLEFAAKYKDSLLLNRYQAGRDQIARGRKKAPYAYVVPQEQRDPVAAVELLRRLAFGGVRVSQLDRRRDDRRRHRYPAGTWVIPTDQEFAAMAREVLDVQKYPDLRAVSRRPARAPVRRRRLDAAAADGRARRRRRDAADRRRAREDEAARPRCPTPKVEADAVRRGVADRRRAVRQRAGRRLRHRPGAAAIVPPAGASPAAGAALVARSGAEQRVPRDQSRVEGAARPCSSPDGALRRHAACPSAQQDELVKSLALQAERTDGRRARRATDRASGCSSRGPAAWTKAGRAGCSSSTASSTSIAASRRTSSRRSRGKVDVADPCRRCAGAGGGGGRPRRARRRTVARRAARVRRHADGRTICARSSSSSAAAARSSA